MTRAAARADADAICAIYNAGIAGRQATFEASPRTTEDVLGWYDDGRRSSSSPRRPAICAFS